MIVQDRNGGFVRPHPNLIIWGDPEIGFQGLYELDTWRYRRGPTGWVDDWESRIDKANSKVRSEKLEMAREATKEAWYHTHVPKAYVKKDW